MKGCSSDLEIPRMNKASFVKIRLFCNYIPILKITAFESMIDSLLGANYGHQTILETKYDPVE